MHSHLLSTIPLRLFYESFAAYTANNFAQFLATHFGNEITIGLINKYNVGTSKHWQGATVFWQVDITGRIRTGKIMKYDAATGKRVKKPYNHITWAHTVLKLPDYELRQCLFGEHLLAADCHGEPRRTMTAERRYKSRRIAAIVESEKTAIIASVYLPQFIWLACGSLTNLTAEKCKVLSGHKVVLFPDLNGYDKWSLKAKELASIAHITVSGLLERKAGDEDRKKGLDLADFLLKFELSDFLRADSPPVKIRSAALP